MVVYMHINGMVSAFNKKGEQIPQAQGSWFGTYLEKLESSGFNLHEIDFMLPDGTRCKATISNDGIIEWEFVSAEIQNGHDQKKCSKVFRTPP